MYVEPLNILNYQKKLYIYICIYIYIQALAALYAKLTYCDYLYENFEHSDLRITKIWVQQK